MARKEVISPCPPSRSPGTDGPRRRRFPLSPPEDELRHWARRHVERVRHLKKSIAYYALGMLVLTPIWALVQWQDNGAFERFSTHSNPVTGSLDLLRGSHLGSVGRDRRGEGVLRPPDHRGGDRPRDRAPDLAPLARLVRGARAMAGRPPYARLGRSASRYRWSRRLYHGGDGCERRSTRQKQSRALVRRFDCAFVGRMAPPCFPRGGVVHSALGSIGADTDGPPWKVRGRARTTHPPPEPRGVPPPLAEGTAVRASRRRADRFTALAHDRGTSRARAARRTHRQRRHTRYRAPSLTTASHRWNPSRQSSLPITAGPS